MKQTQNTKNKLQAIHNHIKPITLQRQAAPHEMVVNLVQTSFEENHTFWQKELQQFMLTCMHNKGHAMSLKGKAKITLPKRPV